MNPSSNLFLIGPMGAGKSTVGRKLAARFGLRFIDLDHEIERATGASVNLIFEIEGEPQFRDRESKLLDAASRNSCVLLATGGGAVLRAENRECLAQRGFVVYLETDVDTQLARLKRDRARPLLRTPDPRAKLLELAAARNALYRQTADFTWTSGSTTARSAAESLVFNLRHRWQQSLE
jgi:shikimate kinase